MSKQDYRTNNALIDAYSKAHNEPDDIVARSKAIYVPHIWRGGLFIPGFGYSTERIENGFTTLAKAGSWRAALAFEVKCRGE